MNLQVHFSVYSKPVHIPANSKGSHAHFPHSFSKVVDKNDIKNVHSFYTLLYSVLYSFLILCTYDLQIQVYIEMFLKVVLTFS